MSDTISFTIGIIRGYLVLSRFTMFVRMFLPFHSLLFSIPTRTHDTEHYTPVSDVGPVSSKTKDFDF